MDFTKDESKYDQIAEALVSNYFSQRENGVSLWPVNTTKNHLENANTLWKDNEVQAIEKSCDLISTTSAMRREIVSKTVCDSEEIREYRRKYNSAMENIYGDERRNAKEMKKIGGKLKLKQNMERVRKESSNFSDKNGKKLKNQVKLELNNIVVKLRGKVKFKANFLRNTVKIWLGTGQFFLLNDKSKCEISYDQRNIRKGKIIDENKSATAKECKKTNQEEWKKKKWAQDRRKSFTTKISLNCALKSEWKKQKNKKQKKRTNLEKFIVKKKRKLTYQSNLGNTKEVCLAKVVISLRNRSQVSTQRKSTCWPYDPGDRPPAGLLIAIHSVMMCFPPNCEEPGGQPPNPELQILTRRPFDPGGHLPADLQMDIRADQITKVLQKDRQNF